MAIKPKLRNILEIIGDLSNHDVGTNVVDTSVVQKTKDLSTEELQDCFNELELLGLIKILKPIDMKEKKTAKPLD